MFMTNKEKDIFTWAFDLIGYFNHYSFFTEKLWRKVEGFEYADEGNVLFEEKDITQIKNVKIPLPKRKKSE